ncbi:MAG: YkgJ family cysteine cluster protein [Pyrinomonadaceae bacterium]
MRELPILTIKISCDSCPDKCCSQPYDWVYLTSREISQLEAASGFPREKFVVRQKNSSTGHEFRILNLPCPFFEAQTGLCTVYDSRPLGCRLFPFYLDPLTGDATFHPASCGEQLSFPSPNTKEGWCLRDLEGSAREWLTEFWQEARIKD